MVGFEEPDIKEIIMEVELIRIRIEIAVKFNQYVYFKEITLLIKYNCAKL